MAALAHDLANVAVVDSVENPYLRGVRFVDLGVAEGLHGGWDRERARIDDLLGLLSHHDMPDLRMDNLNPKPTTEPLLIFLLLFRRLNFRRTFHIHKLLALSIEFYK